MGFTIIRCAIIGDGAVGKTTLLTKICLGQTHTDYIPTVLDMYETLVPAGDGINIKLQFLDLAGQEDYQKFREYQYKSDIDIIIMTFSLVSKASFENLAYRWLSELQKMNKFKNTPILLVGTKKDNRDLYNRLDHPSKDSCISTDEGLEFAKILRAGYVECSSFTGDGIDEVINKLIEICKIKTLIKPKIQKRSSLFA